MVGWVTVTVTGGCLVALCFEVGEWCCTILG